MRFVLFGLICFFSATAYAQDVNQCKTEHDQIDADIKAGNFCEVAGDCKVLELGGQFVAFGCYHFINKGIDRESLYKRMSEYYERCNPPINDCAPTPTPVCVDKKCVGSEEHL